MWLTEPFSWSICSWKFNWFVPQPFHTFVVAVLSELYPPSANRQPINFKISNVWSTYSPGKGRKLDFDADGCVLHQYRSCFLYHNSDNQWFFLKIIHNFLFFKRCTWNMCKIWPVNLPPPPPLSLSEFLLLKNAKLI